MITHNESIKSLSIGYLKALFLCCAFLAIGWVAFGDKNSPLKTAQSHQCGPISDTVTWGDIQRCFAHVEPEPETPEPEPPVIPVDPGLPPLAAGCAASTLAQLQECIKSDTQVSIANDIAVSGCPTRILVNNVNNLTLNGNGFTITRTAGQQDCTLLNIVNSSNVEINQLAFNDNPNVAPCAVGDKCARMIEVTDSSNVAFIKSSIKYAKSYTIYTTRVNGFKFIESELSDAGILGLYIGHGDNPSSNVVISNSVFRRNATNAVAVLGGTEVEISNNIFDNNHREGRWPVSAQYGEGFTGGGQLYLARGSNVQVTGNTFENGRCDNCKGGVHAIELSEPNRSTSLFDITISGNEIAAHTGSNIYTNVGAVVADLVIDNTVPSTPVTPMTSCQVQAGTLSAAVTEYNKSCTLPRKDCDPVDGVWICSSDTITSTTKLIVDVAPPTTQSASLRIEAESVPLTAGWKNLGDGSITWVNNVVAERYTDAQRNEDAHLIYNINVPVSGVYRFNVRAKTGQIFNAAEPPNDFWVRVGNHNWFKVWYRRDGNWQDGATVSGELGHEQGKHLLDFQLSAGPNTVIISGRSRGAVIDWWELLPQGFTVGSLTNPAAIAVGGAPDNNVLLSLHMDHWPDQDDMQYAVAAKMVMDKLDYKYMAVNGTYGENSNDPPHLQFIDDSVPHMRALFPTHLDAHNNLNGTVQTMADRWSAQIRAGGSVVISEGGTSDKTARALRLMPNDVDKKKITVYQHSAGKGAFNEDKAKPENLTYVKSVTNYRAVPNGNIGGNGSADFQEPASSAMCKRFMARAKTSKYGTQWTNAYNKIGDTRKCDMSDTVSLLAGIGDTSTKTFDDFVVRYF